MRVLLVVVAVLAGLGALLVVPAPVSPRTDRHGDGELAEALARVVERHGGAGYDRLSVAVVDRGAVRVAGLGADPGTPFQLASVAKALTGSLLADAVGRGEVTPATTLGEVFGAGRFADPVVAGVSLAELATHRSGIGARLPGAWWRSVPAVFGGPVLDSGDPGDVVAAVAALLAADLGSRGRFDYSNLGMGVLGQALAARAGMSYGQLLRTRLVAGAAVGEVPPGAADPGDELGRPVAPVVVAGLEPAGAGVYASAVDLARLLAAPVVAGARSGFGWVRVAGMSLHSGGFAGAGSFVAVTDEGRGVVVLGNTSRSVEPLGMELLGLPAAPGVVPPEPLVLVVALGVVSLGVLVVPPLLVWRRGLDRVSGPTVLLASAAVTLASWNLAPDAWWFRVLWPATVASLAVTTVTLSSQWPTLGSRGTWFRRTAHSAAWLVSTALLALGTAGWW
ncbi:serine hydrolase domain-containing protein [Amycolatopsis suaedae]|uniref:Class A beta-lactamase-related serine hydrolase n=1 Tax=Amycolatopsis suaedae TaxID=2510978 RepID=A0A4V2ELJ7_9PSEU|nr:serine hydrolase domain-containing protein [Amycolatopsis suaedae]RZQ61805.1 class A beta-lactamase-related serine hydrolase [Amycolatopsis suaedae]